MKSTGVGWGGYPRSHRRLHSLPLVLILISIILIQLTVFPTPTANAQTRIASLTLNPGENSLTSAVIDTAGGYAYFGTGTSPGFVVKVRLSDFTRVDALTLNPGESYLYSAVIDSAGGYTYFGTYTSPGIVVKIGVTRAYSLSAKTDPGGTAWVSQPYILGFKVATDSYSDSHVGDFSYTGTGWSATDASFSATLGSGESLFLIATAQVWNQYSNVGSSIAVCRGGTRVSGDMFCAGATVTSREAAVAIAFDTA